MDSESWINSPFLKSLRKELGWTQEELARRADLSVRVVAKAEAGGVVAHSTLDALAKAYSLAGVPTTLADLKCSPIALARRFVRNYLEFGADFVQKSLDIVSPDIVAVMDGDPTTNPLAGTYRGIEEFDGLWKKFFAIFVRDGGSLGEESQFRSIGNEVFAWGHEYIRVPQSGPQPAGLVMIRMRFESGLMTYFEDLYEASNMMRQLELWAREFPDADWLDHVHRDSLLNGDYVKLQATPSTPVDQGSTAE